jgi:CheY-like chemotaxis protein
MKILLCEDDPVCATIIQRKLEREKGVEVFLARDGNEAMKNLTSGNAFDLIITDIHMPHFSGDQILEFVRQDLRWKTPIIMLSADVEEEVVALAMKEGVDAFMKKPVKPDEILKTIKKLVKVK